MSLKKIYDRIFDEFEIETCSREDVLRALDDRHVLANWLKRSLEAIRAQATAKRQGPFQKSMRVLLDEIEGRHQASNTTRPPAVSAAENEEESGDE